MKCLLLLCNIDISKLIALIERYSIMYYWVLGIGYWVFGIGVYRKSVQVSYISTLLLSSNPRKSYVLIKFIIHRISVNVFAGKFEFNMRRVDRAVGGRILLY